MFKEIFDNVSKYRVHYKENANRTGMLYSRLHSDENLPILVLFETLFFPLLILPQT